ncbi:MAG: rhodanese-like domain-containing protein [Rubrobacter sp.]|nr:rhodanese-like domain-containing protein [Rubrobacter sp.]
MADGDEELAAEGRETKEQTGVEDVHEALRSEEVTIVDVREQEEWEVDHIPGAKLIPLGSLGSRAAGELPDRDARIVVQCAAGGRGAQTARTLREMGYEVE